MRAFSCPVCRHLVTFEATRCLNCGATLGFDWDEREVAEVAEALARCANVLVAACNGLTREAGALCRSCALTQTRPSDGDHDGLLAFAEAEAAKRRLVFELLELGLPVGPPLRFDLLSSSAGPVTTGHADGLVTLDLAEVDPAHRERVRLQMGEPYRTVLGHLRHEIAHYFQPLLAPEGSPRLDRCRELFGDDRDDYQAAMDRHYEEGPPADWPERYVSAYASMHPWEDWAETFAHLLHIRATLQTAASWGVVVEGPDVPTTDPIPLHSDPADDVSDLDRALEAWLPLSYALNAINRTMGADDVYPFVLSPPVVEKLRFVDHLVSEGPSSA